MEILCLLTSMSVQCYKFETKTDLEEALPEDLVLASGQGTILTIKVGGRVYGSGGYRSPLRARDVAGRIALLLGLGLLLCGIFLAARHFRQRRKKTMPPSLQEGLKAQNEDAVMT